MSEDLIQRLRRAHGNLRYLRRDISMLQEAADEIERLQDLANLLMKIPRYREFSADQTYGWLCMSCEETDRWQPQAIKHADWCSVAKVEALLKALELPPAPNEELNKLLHAEVPWEDDKEKGEWQK